MFKCSNGKYINPALVTMCYIVEAGTIYYAVFCFNNGGVAEAAHETREEAEAEIARFLEAFKECQQ